MSHTALLEIGVEEIPAGVVLPALQQMRELAAVGLERARLESGEIRTYGTPRRLVLIVSEVGEKQPDTTREIKGPPAAQAFDADGNLTKAGEGFARSRGLDPSLLQVRDTDKGRFVFAEVMEEGLPATQVLADLWPDLIRKLTFPKTMRWAHITMRFARPIRCIVALYGSETVAFEIAEVTSGRSSRGHRFLHSGDVEIASADDYLQALERASVMVDHERRQRVIADQAQAAAESAGGSARIDPALLEEVAFLVEWPTCLCGAFPEGYLALPEPVLVTVMAKHQRYLPVEGPDGKLLPRFVAIHNGDERSLDVVCRGNEMVIVPRFADAQFYHDEDTKRALADRLPDLLRVTFMERQGSLRQKTDRVVALVRELSREVGLDAPTSEAAAEAARLCKCDLVTLMVQDLTSLQGVVGAEYLRKEGVAEPICLAVEEHYRPRFAGDEPPSSPAGSVVSLADKLDNLAACFAVNLIPKGTSDPYALRRQAAGVVAVLLGRRWRTDLPARLSGAVGRLPYRELDEPQAIAALTDFIGLRLDAVLEAAGVAYDLRRAVLARMGPDVVDAHDRGLALAALRAQDSELFAEVTFAAARTGKIVRPAADHTAEQVHPECFEDEIEGKLWEALSETKSQVDALLASPAERDYEAVWAALCALERPIWDYFDVDTGVMVMAENRDVRANRLATLRAADELFLRLADFTEVVVE
ncbi:MAG: glycine--tRNA ligase subunit beta [Armatimonadetes bacterium]|nr:glycine--tRNA ligase subunit beta [Armatimonadota bacterium]